MAWSQIDSRWSTILLGSGPDTIGPSAKSKYGAGCYLVSDADILTWMGHPITPLQLNQLYKTNGIYVQGELLRDSALHQAFPNLINLTSTYVPTGAADLSRCDNSGPDYVVVFIQFPHGLVTDSPHFAPVWSYRKGQPASSLLICDSYDGVVKPLSRYGDPATIICKVLRFTPVTAKPAPPPPPPPPPPPADLYVVSADDKTVILSSNEATAALAAAAVWVDQHRGRSANVTKNGQAFKAFPAVPPPPPPYYVVRDSAGTVIEAHLTDLTAAKERADLWALTRPGQIVMVDDDSGKTLYTQIVAVPVTPDPDSGSGPPKGRGCLLFGLG